MSFVISTVVTTPQILNGGTAGVILHGGAVVGGATLSGTVDVRTDGNATLHVDGAIINTLDNGSVAPAIDVRNADGNFDTLANSLKLYVGDTGTVASTNGYGLSGRANVVQVTNHGEIFGDSRAISAYGRLEVNNTGDISSNGRSIYHAAGASAFVVVVNSGTISANSDHAIFTSGTLDLQNSGTIVATSPGTAGSGVRSGGLHDDVWNSGVIDASIDLGNGNNDLINSGTITGRVVFGENDDTLINDGTIMGDVFMDLNDFIGGSDAIANSGTIAGLIYGFGFDLDIQNTGELQAGVLDLVGNVFNAGVIGRNVESGVFNPVLRMSGSLVNTNLILGQVTLSENAIVENSGQITGGIFHDGTVFDLKNSGLIDGLNTSADFATVLNEGEMTGSILVSGMSGITFENAGSMGGAEIFGQGPTAFLNSGSVTGFLFVDGIVSSVWNTGEIMGDLLVGNSKGFDGTRTETSLMNFGLITGDALLDDAGSTFVNGGEVGGDVLLSSVIGPGEAFRMVADGSVGGTIFGQDGNDKIIGGRFDDVIDGGRQVDDLLGGAGDDVMRGDSGNDFLKGQGGNDDLNGGGGGDEMSGGAGDDTLFGSAGRDFLFGNAGDDTLDGGTSNDLLNGGRGSDILTGGIGTDVFVFGLAAGSDTITDFEDGVDRIDLRAYGLTPADLTAPGALSDFGSSAIVDLTALGGRGEIVLAGMAGDLEASDFIL